jgi:hypothetical protein
MKSAYGCLHKTGLEQGGLRVSFDDARQLLVFDYRVMTFLVSLGVIQLAAARSSLIGLWLVTRREMVRRIGWFLVAGGLLLYLLLPLWQSGPWAIAAGAASPQTWHTAPVGDLTAAHNISDTQGGLSGNTQATLLITSAFAATLVSALFGARTVNRLRAPKPSDDAIGFETLDGANLVTAIRSAWLPGHHRAAPVSRAGTARAGPKGPP